MTKKYARYTDEYRREAVEFVLGSGKPITECARSLGVNPKTLNDWVVKFRRRGEVSAARTDGERELAEARRRIAELEDENAFLKKAAAFFASGRARAQGTSSCARRGQTTRSGPWRACSE